MSRRHKRGSAEVNLGFQIAPMIDVVFVIMLYFMVMAGAVQVENALNTKLPGAPDDTKEAVDMPEEVAIKVEDDGHVYLNEEPLDTADGKGGMPQLRSSLVDLQRGSVAAKTKVLVTIYASEQAKYSRVVDVLNELAFAKIGDVTFQAGAPE